MFIFLTLRTRTFAKTRLFVVLTCLLISPASVFAAGWSSDPGINNPISTVVGEQYDVEVSSDGLGGAIMVWADLRNGSNYDIYAQRINAQGDVQWPANGVPISAGAGNQFNPKLTSDGAGGAIITWIDDRNSTQSHNNIYAQRVNTSGNAQWTTDGVAICPAPNNQGLTQIISDGASGAIITWVDKRNGLDDNIYAQRLNTSGEVQWTTDGVAICAAAGDQEFPQLTSDGSGGAIVSWADHRGGLDNDIYAQRVNTSGEVQWATDGVGICTEAGVQASPQLTADGSGGAIIMWTDDRSTVTLEDIYAQRVNSSGMVQWAADGIGICTTAHDQALPQLVGDGAGGAIITWNDSRNGTDADIFAQRVNAGGTAQWAANGVPLSMAANDQISPQLVSDGAGGAIITWYDLRSGNGLLSDVYAQHVTASGALQWTSNGVAVCTAPRYQFFSQIASNGAGGAIIAWEDGRSTVTNSDIYASRVTSDGLLGQTTVTQIVDTTFTTGISGWTQFGTTNAFQSASYDNANDALIAHVNSVAGDNDYRIIGWLSAAKDTFDYASVGSSNFLRAKFYVYASGQTGTALNEIPNFRARIASRFAYSAILQPFNHDNADPDGTALGQDVRPSTSPLAPSIYRVDLDPPDVPQLVNHSNTEGFLRLFEAYEGGHQGNGELGLVESTIGVYPALTSFDNSTTVPVSQNGLIKSYLPGASDGGDFGGNFSASTPGVFLTTNGAVSIVKTFNGSAETTGPMPSVTINSAGVTLETLSVQSDRYGACALDTFGDILDQASHTSRARIEPGKQYRVRFHATSTKQSNTQALMRFRVRTLKFLYTANLEVGSSHNLPPSNVSTTIAAEALPGIGNQLPLFDKINPSENGGWYNVMMVTPMNPDIQANQPNIYAQDGPDIDTMPADNSQSRRDIQFGMDIIDTFSTQPDAVVEAGQMTVDRVDVEKYDLVPD